MGATADGGRTVNGPCPARGSVRPVAAFLALALGGTWSYDLVVGWWLDGWDRPWVGDLRILGPTAAAVVVTGATAGRAGLEDLWRATTRWRVGLRWYAVALLGVPACYAVAVLVTPGAEAAFDPPSASLLLLYPLLIPAAAVLGGPLLEEPGWRGFLLPHLLALTTPARASVVVGLVWAAWHATQYLDPDFADSNGGRSPLAVGSFVVTAVSVSVVITWVFLRTGGSILIAVLVHNGVNVTQAATNDFFPGFDASPVRVATAFTLLALGVAAATSRTLGAAPTTARAGR